MKQKILIMITIGSIFLTALTGCGDSSGDRTTSDRAARSDVATTDAAERFDAPKDGEAGLYQSDGSFILWDDLGIDIETNYDFGGDIDFIYREAKLPYRVFKDNGYEGELVLPDTITSIGEYAFLGCSSLTSIDLPDTITSIGVGAFGCSKSLTNIDYAGTMEEWNAIDKVDNWNITHWYLAADAFVIETITCSDGVITLE